MDYQLLFSIASSILAALACFIARAVWNKADRALPRKEFERFKRDDFDKFVEERRQRLDDLRDRLDKVASKDDFVKFMEATGKAMDKLYDNAEKDRAESNKALRELTKALHESHVELLDELHSRK